MFLSITLHRDLRLEVLSTNLFYVYLVLVYSLLEVTIHYRQDFKVAKGVGDSWIFSLCFSDEVVLLAFCTVVVCSRV